MGQTKYYSNAFSLFFKDGPLCAGTFTATQCGFFLLDAATGAISINSAVSTGQQNNPLLFTVSFLYFQLVIALSWPCLRLYMLCFRFDQVTDADVGAASTNGEIQVNFVGVNRPPEFPECADYMMATVAEDAPVGTTVLDVSELLN